MTFPILNQHNVIDLINECWPKINKDFVSIFLSNFGGIDPLEGLILHCLILKYKPRHVIEFSPNAGYSTNWVASAFYTISQKKSFYTFEINKDIVPKLKSTVSKFCDYVSIIEGDAIINVPKIIKEKDLKVDLCFIDSNHGIDFAKKYIENIFPLLSPGCLVCLHDICAENESFKTSLLDSNDKHSGECKIIQKYLSDNKIDRFVLHHLTGGKHEAANLPINRNFYKSIESITGVSFIKKLICPKSLWFNV